MSIFFQRRQKEERQDQLCQSFTYEEIKFFVDFLKKRREAEFTLSYDKSFNTFIVIGEPH